MCIGNNNIYNYIIVCQYAVLFARTRSISVRILTTTPQTLLPVPLDSVVVIRLRIRLVVVEQPAQCEFIKNTRFDYHEQPPAYYHRGKRRLYVQSGRVKHYLKKY